MKKDVLTFTNQKIYCVCLPIRVLLTRGCKNTNKLLYQYSFHLKDHNCLVAPLHLQLEKGLGDEGIFIFTVPAAAASRRAPDFTSPKGSSSSFTRSRKA